MLVPHPLDLIAILLGIFLALRRSDVRAEDPARHPLVAPEAFERWRALALRAYAVGTRACFAKVIVDFAFLALLKRVPFELGLQRAIGVSLDLAWVAAMLTCWVLARRARRYADSVGIDLRAETQTADEPAARSKATGSEP